MSPGKVYSLPNAEPRVLPQALEAERGLLGLLMWSPGEIKAATDLVHEDDFHDPRHWRTLGLLRTLNATDHASTMAALADWAVNRSRAEVETFGGLAYLSSLPERHTAAPLEHYVGLLKEARIRREVIHAATRLEALAMDGDIGDLEAAAMDLRERVQQRPAVEEVRDVVARTAIDLDRVFQEARFIPSGIALIDQDADYGGLSREGVTLILGASGMGKTSLVNRLALGMATCGTAVYLHGTETSTERRMSDMVTSMAATSIRGIDRLRQLSQRGDRGAAADLRALRYRLEDAQDALCRLPLVLTGAGLTVDEVCARARTLHRQGRCGALVVDYLQNLKHVHGHGLRVGERTPQVGYASTRLKDLAAELRIPVVVGAQVSGEKEGPGIDPRPQLWDVQWSSSAHQDAEEVYALFRGDYYTDRGIKLKDPGYPGKLEVIPRKRRVGTLRPLLLDFDGPSRWVAEAL